MIFRELKLTGAWLLEVETFQDERGCFGRTFCQEEFRKRGLEPNVAQCNLSRNSRRGTLRGMHFQAVPFAEVKLVRVVRGSIVDVIVDLRLGSPTYLQYEAVSLSEQSLQMLYVPTHFAHGFQTLEDNTEVLYQMSVSYHPEATRGFAWNDPQIAIEWPLANTSMSPRDAAAPFFCPALLEPLA